MSSDRLRTICPFLKVILYLSPRDEVNSLYSVKSIFMIMLNIIHSYRIFASTVQPYVVYLGISLVVIC